MHNSCLATSCSFVVVVVSGARSGVCELTHQRRLGISEDCLKETGAKTSVRQSCSSGRDEETDVVFEHFNM